MPLVATLTAVVLLLPLTTPLALLLPPLPTPLPPVARRCPSPQCQAISEVDQTTAISELGAALHTRA